MLGAGWATLQPFLKVVVFSVLFGKLARLLPEGLPCPIFAYAGLITKVYFPRMILSAATVLAGLVDLGVASTIMFAMMAFYGVYPGVGIAILPILVVLLAIMALAAGLWLSALNLKYGDVRHAVPS